MVSKLHKNFRITNISEDIKRTLVFRLINEELVPVIMNKDHLLLFSLWTQKYDL